MDSELSAVFGDGGLHHRVAVYVPSTRDVRETIDESDHRMVVNRALTLLATLHGGATAIPVVGAWVTRDGTLVTEKVTIVYSFCAAHTTDSLHELKRFAQQIRDELKQEAISIEVDGELIFV